MTEDDERKKDNKELKDQSQIYLTVTKSSQIFVRFQMKEKLLLVIIFILLSMYVSYELQSQLRADVVVNESHDLACGFLLQQINGNCTVTFMQAPPECEFYRVTAWTLVATLIVFAFLVVVFVVGMSMYSIGKRNGSQASEILPDNKD